MKSEMPEGWAPHALYELADYTNGRATKPTELTEDGVPVIKIAELSRGITDATNRVPASHVQSKHWVRDGDLLFAWSGSVGIHIYRGDEAALNQHIFNVTAHESIDQRFLRYLLLAQMPTFLSFVEGKRTTMGHVTVADLKTTDVPVPPLDEQRRIAAVLGALDDKIESNRRLGASMEEVARTLFNARFVYPLGILDSSSSGIGRIPRRWRARPVGEVVPVVGGATPSTKDSRYWDGGFHCWATPKDLSGLRVPVLINTSRRITDLGVARISSGILPEETVLLSSRAPIGYTAITKVPTAVNQGFIAIPPCQLPAEYILFWIQESMDTIKAHASGTTFAEISKAQFRPIPMLVPPNDQLAEFAETTRPMFDQIAALERELRHFSEVRDEFLPRLVSGRLRVPDTMDPDEVIGPAVEDLHAGSAAED